MTTTENDRSDERLEPTDEDRARARVLWREARFDVDADPEDVVARALAEGRVAGVRAADAMRGHLADEGECTCRSCVLAELGVDRG